MVFGGLYADFSLAYWTALLAISGMGGFMTGFADFGKTLVMVPLFSLLLSPAELYWLAFLLMSWSWHLCFQALLRKLNGNRLYHLWQVV